ncbi:2-keto-4-pentenoate hydratase [Alkalibacillus flavidus]|uniref:2-keto-4-pentenoate hydratase n=1 Tax=Alkalibacillus flavidus TaxID=546021 RepID=A0ABV2KUF7_9BACI
MSVLAQLTDAQRGGPRLARDVTDDADLGKSYTLQEQLVDDFAAQGNPLKGYKISLTSEETQQLFEADEPLYGALLEDSVVAESVALTDLNEPLIEVELMFLVDETIEPGDDESDVLQKTRIAPGIEIPDSRFEDWFPNLSLNQIVMDRAVAEKVIVGDPVYDLQKADLANVEARVTLNGEHLVTGHSQDVMENPLHAMMWLVDALAKRDKRLEAGMIVSSGTFMLPKPLERGRYEVDFAGIGSVGVDVT